MERTGRYATCWVLHEDGIPCVVWFEDAVAHYGVPTVVFDLHLLVEDIDTAAQALRNHGWETAADRANDQYIFFSEKDAKPHHRLVWPEPPNHTGYPNTRTFLFNTTDWCFPAEYLDRSTSPTFPPQLPKLVDALIDSVLDVKGGSMTYDHVAVMLGYLYGYVSEMKKASFADRLTYEHRQFHYDILTIDRFTLKFVAHERTVRQQFRDGTGVLHYDPWNNDRENLA
ncbi:hypothetical protein SPI_06234 [Niveomyces insectorum RCEF 264]|uniref:Uncharacterized protein n=1 Tax=Niveomyces insectorum RCEF 264 TaxID=1081102 RepID=A0A167RXA4_9HYPO|nr:hypothetical protein SPI_06234 [Niveomyces insectorum RCEF 264]